MAVIERAIAPVVLTALADTPVVVVNGARQVGKTTLVAGLEYPSGRACGISAIAVAPKLISFSNTPTVGSAVSKSRQPVHRGPNTCTVSAISPTGSVTGFSSACCSPQHRKPPRSVRGLRPYRSARSGHADDGLGATATCRCPSLVSQLSSAVAELVVTKIRDQDRGSGVGQRHRVCVRRQGVAMMSR